MSFVRPPPVRSDRTTCSPISVCQTRKIELLKSRLVGKIDEVIEKRGLTQAEAGRIMGLPQPKVSELRNGRTTDYSLERLYRLLNNLGVGVSVVLEELPDWTRGEVAVRESEPASERDPSHSMGM